MQRATRIKHELQQLHNLLPTDITCQQVEDSLCHFNASIDGAANTPYKGGVFVVELRLPDRYPFQPPMVKFITPIYHPNIDQSGRICLDQLKMPPAGCWSPSLNIASVLIAVKQLMSEANPDDGLMSEIATQYKSNRTKFNATAQEWTINHAMSVKKTNTPNNANERIITKTDVIADKDEQQPYSSTVGTKRLNAESVSVTESGSKTGKRLKLGLKNSRNNLNA